MILKLTFASSKFIYTILPEKIPVVLVQLVEQYLLPCDIKGMPGNCNLSWALDTFRVTDSNTK